MPAPVAGLKTFVFGMNLSFNPRLRAWEEDSMKYSIMKTAEFIGLAFATLIPLAVTPSLAADMKMTSPMAMSASGPYRFELAEPPKSTGAGTSIVAIKLLHNGKPVSGAVIIQSRADMGPMGMATMTAPIKPLGEKPPGIYRFEIKNGPVWRKPDNWAVSLSAKVQGVMQTVTGSVTVKLLP